MRNTLMFVMLVMGMYGVHAAESDAKETDAPAAEIIKGAAYWKWYERGAGASLVHVLCAAGYSADCWWTGADICGENHPPDGEEDEETFTFHDTNHNQLAIRYIKLKEGEEVIYSLWVGASNLKRLGFLDRAGALLDPLAKLVVVRAVMLQLKSTRFSAYDKHGVQIFKCNVPSDPPPNFKTLASPYVTLSLPNVGTCSDRIECSSVVQPDLGMPNFVGCIIS